MKKIFKTLAVLAVVAALGFGFVSCGDSGDDNNGYRIRDENSTTAVTKETIAPKNFKVEQVEGQNKLKFTWEEGTVKPSYYTLTNTSETNKTNLTYDAALSSIDFWGGTTSYTKDWYWRQADIAVDSGEYEFTLVAEKWSDEASAYIETDPISAKVNFEAKLLAPTVPKNIKPYQTCNLSTFYTAYLNFDQINNNGNYWIWYVSKTNDINTAVIRHVTENSTTRVYFPYEKDEVPANGTTVYVWIKSALKIINTEGKEATSTELQSFQSGKEFSLIKADSDTYSAPTGPYTFVWNIDK